MKKRILVTSGLLYANGAMHFGHIAGNFLPADCYARFQRLLGHEVLYITGSDEYGVAVTFAAEREGRTPQEQVDCYHGINAKLLDMMQISCDHFSRTTCAHHAEPTQRFFLDLVEKGYVEKRKTNQLYSEQDQKFLADRYVEGTCPKCGFEQARGDECPSCGASYEATDLKNPISKLTRAKLVSKETEHWFLLLDAFKEQLVHWIESKPWKANVKNFAKAYLDNLKPRAITRDATWGVSLPAPYDEPGKVFYVWFDAPIGYISAAMEWATLQGNPEQWKTFWLDEKTEYAQFMGKDNIFFHSIWFPAMIFGQKQPFKQVDHLWANEFFKLEGRQFSKSDGWYIDLETFLSKYSSDQARYALAANAPETSDSEFTWKDFQSRCNADLVGKWGNLVNRVLVFAHRFCQGQVPKRSQLDTRDQEFVHQLAQLATQAKESFQGAHLRQAVRTVMEIAQAGNIYFDAKKPWVLAKDQASHDQLATTIALCLQCLKQLALFSFPIIPEAAAKLWKMLGCEKPIDQVALDEELNIELPAEQQLQEPTVLFRKIEDTEIEKEEAALYQSSQPATKVEPLKDQVTFEDFTKLDLRVGKVLQAERLKKSKKLLHLQVDIGNEVRSIVSGIYPSYQPEELAGRSVVVVANLKPAKLMGVLSEGMILATEVEEGLQLASPGEGALPGQVVS